MISTSKHLWDLVASDLMTQKVVVLPDWMPLREGASTLLRAGSTGAPVVDAAGRCVGVLSTSDFLRLAAYRNRPPRTLRPLSCAFLTDNQLSDGETVTLCTLPHGTCSLQGQQKPGCLGLPICREPHGVSTEWQVVEVEKLPTDEVRCFMTPDPVTTGPGTSIHALARMMIDAHIHRVIIVDGEQKPVGIVSSTDLLAALAYPHDDSTSDPSAA
jgi:CBS domain-containing protein